MCLSHDSLANYFETNFVLMNSHKYDLGDIDQMFPYEREIYISLLAQHLEKEKQRLMNDG